MFIYYNHNKSIKFNSFQIKLEMHKSRGGRDNNSNSDMPVVNKIFTEQYKGIELNCLVGNIMECSNTAIGIICDSRFVLNGGLGRSIKETAGAEFMANLQIARGVQQNTTAIAVQSTRNLRSSHVILYPIRSVDRDVLDRAYVGIFNKAIELQIPTLTIPLLGTGQLGLGIDAAINYLRTAFSQMSNFGHIQKLQFIDRNENTMLSLISGYLNQLIQGQNSGGASTSQQQPQGHNSGSSSSNSFLAIGSGASDSPIQLYPRIHHNDHRLSDQGTSSNSNATQFSSASHTGSSSINLNISINLGGGTTDEDQMDDENEDLSFADTGDDNDGNSDNDNEDDSDSDLEDSSDEDGGFSSDDTIWSTNTDESQQMDATNSAADETAYEMMQRIAEEKTFWKKITLDELAMDNEAEDEQLFQQPMSSSSSRLKAKEKTKARLDDTTMPCSICLSDMREEQENTDAIVQLTLCSHIYHEECIRAAFKVKKQCPLCMCFYGNPIGCQPLNATMHDRQISGKVPGHPDANGYHEITYHIPSGVQTENHPRPGEPYRSSTRIAYLPNNAEGTEVLKLLKLAFKRRLIFTIGDSVTTGRKNVPVWNGIHHKTIIYNKDGGEHCYGYPDPQYLQRVKEELAMVGVCRDQL